MCWPKITILSALLLTGCAARPIKHARMPQGFWGGCTPSVPATPDGFDHFTCIDVNHQQWEVLLRKEPKSKGKTK